MFLVYVYSSILMFVRSRACGVMICNFLAWDARRKLSNTTPVCATATNSKQPAECMPTVIKDDPIVIIINHSG